jgi:hypothetical protein
MKPINMTVFYFAIWRASPMNHLAEHGKQTQNTAKAAAAL